jgi:BlaI family transcriptional regulator, penicillinase repressor
VPRKQSLPPLSERQLEIMDVIWIRGETTVGEVWTELARTRNIARNTIQTTITRLEEKGWLRHRAEGHTFYYRATQPSDDDRKKMARRLVDTVFQGSTEGLLLAILDEKPLSQDEANHIRKLIDDRT